MKECNKCGEKMYVGYAMPFADKYICSEKCLLTDGYTKKDYEMDYIEGDIYWTEWEEKENE